MTMNLKNIFLLLMTQLSILLSLSACSVQDTDIDNPLVGKTIELKSPLFILNDLKNNTSSTNSPTALELGNISLTIDFLTSCAGCNFKALNLKEFLPIHSKIHIIKAYRSDPPFFHIDSSSMDYFVAQTESGIKFAIPVYRVEDMMKKESHRNKMGEKMESLLNSFSNKDEKKSFYFQTQPFYQERLFPTKKPPFSSEDVTNTFKEVFANIGKFNITNIDTNTGQLGFSVTTDREGLAYLLFKTSEEYIEVSPYQKMN